MGDPLLGQEMAELCGFSFVRFCSIAERKVLCGFQGLRFCAFTGTRGIPRDSVGPIW
jgi:hypothetical protein